MDDEDSSRCEVEPLRASSVVKTASTKEGTASRKASNMKAVESQMSVAASLADVRASNVAFSLASIPVSPATERVQASMSHEDFRTYPSTTRVKKKIAPLPLHLTHQDYRSPQNAASGSTFPDVFSPKSNLTLQNLTMSPEPMTPNDDVQVKTRKKRRFCCGLLTCLK
eukprot:CAMPEP_0204916426 /NCGR_PEP_ID=MMETSP1397-20131031/14236_1 /ASSEMBLY_ACC=CAM_ASM_000891 /TAXON_ID=49980 /ORGANISM="Climacostomum Climacostomum virens, Strain Stock W-24" /LENGTH=167 /DNA_ID=CAMNT_0052088913 /DNA_START=431 /DNA_END=934 /DNA_ORIENTATION=-